MTREEALDFIGCREQDSIETIEKKCQQKEQEIAAIHDTPYSSEKANLNKMLEEAKNVLLPKLETRPTKPRIIKIRN